MHKKLFVLVGLSLGFFLGFGIARGDGIIQKSNVYVKPSPSDLERIDSKPNKQIYVVSCYAYYGIMGKPINCSFTMQVSYPPTEPYPAIQETGGHEHGFETRPLIYRERHFIQGALGPIPIYDGSGKLEFQFDQDSSNDKRVVGQTMPAGGLFNEAEIKYPVSEVSGEAQVDIKVTPPRFYYCIYACYTKKLIWYRDLMHVGLQELVKLPDPGPDDRYIKVRTTETAHPKSLAYYIKKKHIKDLKALAAFYYKYTSPHRILSLNDMTLPLGGLFDVEANWKPPHSSHRDGTDADVNRDSIDCLDDKTLIHAAQKVLPNLRNKYGKGGKTDSALLCESHGRKHIDFEREGH